MKAKQSKNHMGPVGETPKSGGSPMRIGKEPDAGESIGLADEGKTPDCADLRKNRNKWLKRKYRIGTWNIRSMAAGKLNTVIGEANENKLDLLGLVEHRWAGSGHFTTSCGGKLIYSGRERAGQSGVVVYLSKATTKSLLEYKPVNDRILTIRLQGQAKNITLIQVYASTSASTEGDLENFYDAIQKEVGSKESKDILIISGDFNAKVGKKKNSEEDSIIGNAGLGERYRRGDTLVDFALANQLAIKNTMFEKHPRRLHIWTPPDGKTRNQIDYIMIKKDGWATMIQYVTTRPNADCDTDHELLVATL